MGSDVTVRVQCMLFSLLCSILYCATATTHSTRKQLPSAVVVGTVYCDTCFHQELSKSSHLISGASVAVECGDAATEPNFRKEVKTNKHGVFKVRLPRLINKDTNLIQACSVKLVKSNEPFCAVASSATSTGLRLRYRKNGVRVFSAGFFTFKPLKQPELCYQKPLSGDQKVEQSAFFFPSPSIPFVPSPPNIGGVPLPPNPFQPPPPLLPPNPFQPPPPLLPPNPFQPPLPVIPPVFQPPSPPPFNIPPLPFLTPPPPPPIFRFPPAFPFPPSPLVPGIPPVFPSKKISP